IEAGYSPASVISNLNDPILTPEGDWVPEDEHSTANSMTLRTALKISSNRAAVQLLRTVAIPSAVSHAQKLNVGTPPSVPSLALGASEVTLLALTAAYGAFADGGIVHQPVFIRRVEDSEGNVLFEEKGRSRRAVSEATAFLMASMLSDVINHGTAYRARQVGFTLPAAGKTGTTNDYVDAWFVGFTPRVVTGVWIGFDKPRSIIANGYAGELAVPLWASFMKTATKGHKADWFDRPSDVVSANVCRVSGRLPNAGCHSVATVSSDGWTTTRSMVYAEYFKRGTQPSGVCPIHTQPAYVEALASGVGEDIPRPASGDATESAPPAPAATTGSPTPAPQPAQVSPAASTEAAVAEAEEKPKRRGFWSRVFGRGGDKDDKNNKKDDKKPPRKPDGR
ncbi:MAG TPA: penicillin-binding transpeptidase domain-containing protein, partial [Vicinamibacterales bacterium]|nr:penicillin-binding transpeptidase domain-containing protein [Vicinamibacterales bacterium]